MRQGDPGVSRKKEIHGVPEKLLEMEVQRPGRPVIVHIGVKVQPGVQEPGQDRRARLVQGQALPGEKGVVDEPLDVDHVHGVARHVGIPLDVIEIVHGVNARKKVSQEPKPERVPVPFRGEGLGTPYEIGHL